MHKLKQRTVAVGLEPTDGALGGTDEYPMDSNSNAA